MPSVSSVQRRKMAVLFKQGKITKKQWLDFQKVETSKKSGSKKSKK